MVEVNEQDYRREIYLLIVKAFINSNNYFGRGGLYQKKI
jgi:hypothetical protein